MKLVFGAINCDTDGPGPRLVTREMRIRKSPSSQGSRAQNVFVPPEYQSLINEESLSEEVTKGLLCEPRPQGPRKGRPDYDIALIRLERPLSDDDLRYETSNINTICVEHSKKVPFTVDRPLTAYAAGFGLKDNYGKKPKTEYRLVEGPELSFLRFTVFQNGVFRVNRPHGPRSEKDVLLGYEEEISNEEQFALSLDDDERRDTAEVSVTFF